MDVSIDSHKIISSNKKNEILDFINKLNDTTVNQIIDTLINEQLLTISNNKPQFFFLPETMNPYFEKTWITPIKNFNDNTLNIDVPNSWINTDTFAFTGNGDFFIQWLIYHLVVNDKSSTSYVNSQEYINQFKFADSSNVISLGAKNLSDILLLNNKSTYNLFISFKYAVNAVKEYVSSVKDCADKQYLVNKLNREYMELVKLLGNQIEF